MGRKNQLIWGGIFFLCLMSSQAFAAESACLQTDIRSQLSPGLQSFFSKSRQQGDTNWCYAFTTADLVTIHTGKPISAFQIAINYNSQLGSFDRLWRHFEAWLAGYQISIWDGGFVSVALKAALNSPQGVCPEESLPSSENNLEFKKIMEKVDAYLHGKIEIYMDTFAELKKMFPKIKESDLLELLYLAQEKSLNANQFLQAIAHFSCKNSAVAVPRAKVMSHNRWTDNLSQVLRWNLKNGIATGLIYDSTLTHKVPQGEETWLTGKVPDHATLALGSRWKEDKQKCQILIRDSFGDDCSKLNLQKVDCNHDGTFWIDEDLLVSKLFFTSHFSKY